MASSGCIRVRGHYSRLLFCSLEKQGGYGMLLMRGCCCIWQKCRQLVSISSLYFLYSKEKPRPSCSTKMSNCYSGKKCNQFTMIVHFSILLLCNCSYALENHQLSGINVEMQIQLAYNRSFYPKHVHFAARWQSCIQTKQQVPKLLLQNSIR